LAEFLAELVAKSVFLANGAFGISLCGDISAAVAFVIFEVLRPLGSLGYFETEFHNNMFFKGFDTIQYAIAVP
jgi:hypothetical protein